MLKVHGVHGSPFVRKVLIVLEMKGIPYEIVTQMPFTGDAKYKALNPLGKIPTLVDGALTLGDSKVICRYLESAYPDIAVYPADVSDRAMADWYDDFSSGALAELAAGIFFQRYMRPRAFKQEPDEALISKIIEKKLSVRQAENFVQLFKKKRQKSKITKDTNIIALELSVSNKIGLNVEIQNNKRNKGKISFEYKDLDQLNKIIDIKFLIAIVC